MISIKCKIACILLKRVTSKQSDEDFIKNFLKSQDFKYGESRKVEYKAPKGYRHTQILVDNVNLESLSKQNSPTNKVIYMLHGGAYVGSLKDSMCGMMELYCNNGKYKVYALDYRVAPKDPYPAALNDAIKGYKFLLKEGYSPKDIIVAGDSSGGGLALSLYLKLKEYEDDIPRTFILSSPWVDLSETEFTEEQKKNDVFFGGNNVLEKCSRMYRGSTSSEDELVSPIFGNFSELDHVYISSCKDEVLLDSNIELARTMSMHGVDVVHDIIDSGMHDIIAMKKSFKESRNAWKRIHKYLDSLENLD